MKARFTDNSIRLRLRKSDISTLDKEGEVVMRVDFAPAPFHFRLRLDSDLEVVSAGWQGDGIVVALPEGLGREWMDTDRVGIRSREVRDDGVALDILVEKDFPCAHRPMEDKSDTFHELG